MRPSLTAIVLCSALLCVLPVPVLAATTVQGNISLNTPTLTHWTVAGSPYNIVGDATVLSNATLTIDPGVAIVVSATDASMAGVDPLRVELVINGTLVANGTAMNPITIHGATAGQDTWVGITLSAGSQASSITFATITDAKTAVQMVSTASPTITDLTISNSTNGVQWQSSAMADLERLNISNFFGNGVLLQDDGADGLTATVDQCTIQSSTATTVGVNVATRVNATVTRDFSIMNGTGVSTDPGGSLILENCVIAGNAVAGVSVTQSGTSVFHIINNTIDQNFTTAAGVGVKVLAVTSAANFIIRNNIVTNNGTGVGVTGATVPALDTNDVWNNGTNYLGCMAGANSISVNPIFNNGLGKVPAGGAAWSTLQAGTTACDPPSSGSISCGTPSQVNAGWFQIVANPTTYETIAFTDRAGTPEKSLNQASGTAQILGNSVQIEGTCTYYYNYCYGTYGNVQFLPLAYDYHVGASSPVIDIGNNLGAPSVDMDGSVRPYNATLIPVSTVDIGAYEFHANIPPTAVVGPAQKVLVNSVVTLNGAGSFDSDGTVVSYSWNFGDSTTAGTTAIATHTYTSTGTYTATLTVTDNGGATGTATETITVVTSLPPVAVPGSPEVVELGTPVALNGTASYSPNGTIVAYLWDYGDGSAKGTTPMVSHEYMAAGTYTVTLTVTDNFSATASATVVVGVTTSTGATNPPPVANAGGPYTGIVNQAITFTGAASTASNGTITTYAWQFGDGTTGTGVGPTHAYTASGSYLVQLNVTDSHGGTATSSALATASAPAHAPPVANAGGNQTGAVNQQLTFNASASTASGGATLTGYHWDFGDGGSATTKSATHSYAADGTYVVTLTVTDSDNATGQALAVVSIGTGTGTSSTPPVANAGGPYSGVVNQAITFNGSGSTVATGTITTYAWDFGDGTTGTGVMPTHAYASAASFLVQLTVTGSAGGTATASALATATAPAHTPPVANAGGNQSAGVDVALTFNASASTASGGATLTGFLWDFGDGMTGTMESVTHSYAAAGTYLVRLTVTDSDNATGQDLAVVTIGSGMMATTPVPVAHAGGPYTGTVNQAISFDGSASTTPSGTITSYAWDFGDGSKGTGVMPTHAYTAAASYLVALTVTNNAGGTATASALATASLPTHPAPVAQAGGNQSAMVNQSITFNGSGSTSATGTTLVGFRWDFGDGDSASTETAMHSYSAAGTYLVQLTVTDSEGGTGTDLAIISVTSGASGDHTPPTAMAGSNVSGNAGDTISFSAQGSTDPDGSIVAYQWSFGDGGSAVGASTSHVFALGGAYTVTLTVFDSFGLMASATVTATIFGLPVADAGSDRQGTVGTAVAFDGSASSVAQGTITAYSWDFGDGAVGTGAMASHTYTSAGSFKVTLSVTDDKGGKGSTSITVFVTAVTAPAAKSGCSSSGEAGMIALLVVLAFVGRRRSVRVG